MALFFFFILVSFFIFSIMSGQRGFRLLVCFYSLLLFIFLKYLSPWLFNEAELVRPAHRPTWYHVTANEGDVCNNQWEPASHSCSFSVTTEVGVRLTKAWSTCCCFKMVCENGFSGTKGSGWLHQNNTVFIPMVNTLQALKVKDQGMKILTWKIRLCCTQRICVLVDGDMSFYIHLRFLDGLDYADVRFLTGGNQVSVFFELYFTFL